MKNDTIVNPNFHKQTNEKLCTDISFNEYIIHGVSICLILFFAMYVFILINKENGKPKYQYTPRPEVYYETEIQYQFTDGTTKTEKINVYEFKDNIFLQNGNLQYQKIHLEGGMYLASKVTIASYVKTYSILKQDKKEQLR